MKNRIKENKKYKAEVWNNPFKLLEEIKLKMYGQVWAKYKYTQVTDTLVHFINTKQEHGESLIEYRKGFKQSKDNVKSILGRKFLSDFTQHMDICTATNDSDVKAKLVDGSWDCWTAFMILRNNDGNKYRLLKNHLNN